MRGKWPGQLVLAISGIAWFIWLGIEERTVYFVVVLAALAAIDAVIILPVRDWVTEEGGGVRPLAAGLIGLAIGACVPVVAALLMLVKVSLHSHQQPDFSLAQVVSMVSTMPVWAAAGGLMVAAWLIFTEDIS